ncbi:MAG: XRE family transcriptional regulator [Dehalococcoidia bacterium]|nr:XRE family transcriptional regulator [Dehalococcoidia bacterium]
MATARSIKENRAEQATRAEFPSILGVAFIPSGRALLVLMGNKGGTREYPLYMDDLPDASASGIRTCRISPLKDYLNVTQQSGNVVEIPWDVVLYHAEPDYPYFKGRSTQQRDEQELASSIGTRVQALRKERGMTVTALAEAAGMERPNLSRLEHGKHAPSLETLERVAKGLGMTVAELVGA